MKVKTVNKTQRKENLAGYAFVSPALICYLLLIAFPFFLTLILGFTEFNFLKVKSLAKLGKYIDWVGFENFVDAFADRRFVAAIKNTFVYAIVTVPISIVLGITIYSTSDFWLSLFLPDDPAGIEYGRIRMFFVLLFMSVCCARDVYGSGLQGCGHVMFTTFTSIIGVFGFRLLWMWYQ